MNKWMLVIGALLGASAVLMGAFGAHALKSILSGKPLEWYQTAVDYHSTHAFALLITGILSNLKQQTGRLWLSIAGLCFLMGTLVFSGSLYLMAFTEITALGMVTPIGGVLLVVGWVSLAFAAARLTAHTE